MNNETEEEISKLILDECENFKKNLENILKNSDSLELEKFKIWDGTFQNDLNQIKINFWNSNSFYISLLNIQNNEIILKDKAFQNIELKDILEQINDLEKENYENSENFFSILSDILTEIGTNNEVKIYLNDRNITIPIIKEGVQKLYNNLKNNTLIIAAPREEYKRRLEYNKLLKGFKIIAQILKESSIEPISKLGNIIMISEVSEYCVSGWKDTLLELMTNFSSELKEKYKSSINLDYEEDPMNKILNEIFSNAKESVTKELSYEYIRNNNISISRRPHYIDIFKEVFNEVYGLNLSFIETVDSFIELNHRNSIKEEFVNSLNNVYINDLIYNKACELFNDRLKEEPKFYVGSQIKPKFWGEIMEWNKQCFKNDNNYYYNSNNNDKKFKISKHEDFMTEYIMANENYKDPIRYIAIKEIMKYYGFIEEKFNDNKYGSEFYKKQPKICMTRLKRGIMDIKSEKELKLLNNHLILLKSQGIDIKGLIDFIIDNNRYELLNYIDFNNINININEVDENGCTILLKICKHCNNFELIKSLIDARADINHKDNNGRTALMYTIRYNKDFNISKLLIERGANVNLVDINGYNALIFACRYSNNLELIKLLIEAGSNINQKNNDGRTALNMAKKYNTNNDISKYLIKKKSKLVYALRKMIKAIV